MANRHIPAGARPKTATHSGTNSDRKDSQRMDDIIKEQGIDVNIILINIIINIYINNNK